MTPPVTPSGPAARQRLEGQIAVARTILLGGLTLALSVLVAALMLSAGILVPLGQWGMLAAIAAGEGLIAVLVVGVFLGVHRIVAGLAPAGESEPAEGLEALRRALSDWADREGAVDLGDVPDDARLPEFELRARWATRVLDTVSELDEDLVRLRRADGEEDLRATRESLRQLRQEVSARAEVARVSAQARRGSER